MNGVVVRKACADDYAALQRVYAAASLSNPGDRAALIAHPEHLRLDPLLIGRGRTLVAEVAGGAVVGFASTSLAVAGCLELDDLFVDPDHRRLGAARELVRRIAADAVHESVTRLEVTANSHAMGFYEAVGFRPGETVATPLGNGLRMRLSIEPPST